MTTVGKLICSWDTCEITESQANFLKELGEYPDKTDEELFHIACEDSDVMQMAWDNMVDVITEHMHKHNKHSGWRAKVKNFGWRSQDGHKDFRAESGKELLSQVLPDTECTFKVYRYGHGLAINNAHHDSPTWQEWYYISPKKGA